jgi:DNA-binding transcriptional ArsR family regulator
MHSGAYICGCIPVVDYRARAELFHLLSLENRLRILDELRYGDACVCHLQHMLKRPQAYVSQQLRILKDAGIVDTHKEGANVFYYLTDPLARGVLDKVLGPLEQNRPVDPGCPCPRCAARLCGSPTSFQPADLPALQAAGAQKEEE